MDMTAAGAQQNAVQCRTVEGHQDGRKNSWINESCLDKYMRNRAHDSGRT